MFDGLEMPDTLAGFGVESEQAVGKEVVADAIGPVEIERGRTGGHEKHAAFRIQRHTAQLLAEPLVFQASGGQVPYPNSPGRGMV